MTKHWLKGSFGNHIDPEKEEQLKWVKIGNNYSPPRQKHELSLQLYNWPRMFHTVLRPKRGHFKAHLPAPYSYHRLWYTEWQLIHKIENKVKKIVKLGKSINGNKDGNLKKKSELIHLVEDFHQQYETLYALYEDLRGEVKNNINGGDDDNHSLSSSDSDSYYSPNTLGTPKHEPHHSPQTSTTSKSSETSSDTPSIHSDQNQERETDDSENTILKDKLTSSSEVKETMNLESESQEFGVVLKELSVNEEESDRTKELEGQVASMKIEIETLCAQKRRLKEKLERRSNETIQMLEKISRLEAMVSEFEAKENEFQSCVKKREDDEKGYLSKISDLSTQANTLQLEVNKLRIQKDESEEREAKNVNSLTKKVDHLENELESLKSEKDEMEREIKKKSTEISKLLRQMETLRNDEQEIVKVNEGLKAQVADLEHEVRSLTAKKSELEEKTTKVTLNADQYEVEKEELRGKISELERSLSKSDNEIKASRNEFSTRTVSLEVKAKDLENALETLQNERNSLRTELESLWNDKKRVNLQFEKEKQEFLQIKSQMEKKNADLSKKISDQTVEVESLQNDKKQLNTKLQKQKQDVVLIEKKNADLSKKISDQTVEIEQLNSKLEKQKQEVVIIEKQNAELSNKISDQRKNLQESEETISKLKQELEQSQVKFQDSTTKTFQTVEKRIEETAEEFRKQFEDKYRILSRRIRVAEQLHVETKEWYLKTRDNMEQENKDLKERVENSEFGFKSVKDITLTANDVLVSLDSVALKFEECTANFLNRISKSSCELKFAKDWAMRKNKALLHIKDDLDCLLVQLDGKESEILVFREKVWKSDNKVRELEKMIKEKDDLMMALKEEKREAIRQLCVWIDYHRSRSDYYKKILVSEINTGRRRSVS